jgi:hypothetical protein
MSSDKLRLPKRLKEILEGSGGLYGGVLSSLSELEPWTADNKLSFFPEYTDHGPDHINDVFVTAEALIRDDAWPHVTAEDVTVLVLGILLHDCAMHLSEEGFVALLHRSEWAKPVVGAIDTARWPTLWSEFLREAAKLDGKKLKSLFGDTEPAKPPPLDALRMTKRDRLLIGEFLRRHHPRLAHEIALQGVPGPTTTPLALRNIDRRLADLAGLVARSHGMPLRAAVELLPEEERRETMSIHVPFYGRFEDLRDLGIVIRRLRSNLDDEKAFAKTVDYVPGRAEFQTASADLLKLLVGPLYGNEPEIGVRELLQNAVDACRELEDYLRQSGAPAPDLVGQDADVVIALDMDGAGGAWLSVRDRGIGMTPEVIKEYFLKAGASLRNSDAWRARHVDAQGRSRGWYLVDPWILRGLGVETIVAASRREVLSTITVGDRACVMCFDCSQEVRDPEEAREAEEDLHFWARGMIGDVSSQLDALRPRGRRLLLSRYHRCQELVSGAATGWTTEEARYPSGEVFKSGDCPVEPSSVVRRSGDSTSKPLDTYEGVAEWYLSNSGSPEQPSTRMGRIWAEIVQHPVIPFDVDERRSVLVHAYERLAPYIAAHEDLLKAEQARRGAG